MLAPIKGIRVTAAGVMRAGEEAVVARGSVALASEGASILPSGEESLLLNQIREAGGVLEVPRGAITAQDIATAARASGNEMALYRNLETGQRLIMELGPAGGDIPAASRLILHTQPGAGLLDVIPSAIDRTTLSVLGQRSSVIVNSGGTYSLRFGPVRALDNPIVPIGR